jgi:hypothetical protein
MSLIDKLGRKTLLLIGAIGMTVALAGVAAIFYTPRTPECVGMAAHAFHRLLCYLAGFGDLGLHSGGVSIACALKRPKRRI